MAIDQAKILKAWQLYIEVEGCEKSKIPARLVHSCQNIHFKNSDFIENPESNGVFIELHQEHIRHLKNTFVDYDQETKSETLIDNLSFAFPILTVHERRNTYYLPIFIMDLSSDFLISKDFNGFDLKTNAPEYFKANISVLIKYFDVDVEQIDETKNLIDLVGTICQTHFPNFKSMYIGFLEWANRKLTEKNNNFNEIYFSNHTDGLIFIPKNEDFNTSRDLEDFKFILNEISTHGESILTKKYPLLHYYLTKNISYIDEGLKSSTSTQNHYGLFEKKYPLSKGQFKAIQVTNIFPRIPLLAVQGAPGTGKTTLFKSLISQQITERALAVIAGKDSNMNMLICSTAIKAVDNVIFDLKFDEFTKDLNWLWFHGGSKNKIGTEIHSRLEPHIQHLASAKFDENQYNNLKHRILDIKKSIDIISDSYQSSLRKIEIAKSKAFFLEETNSLDISYISSKLDLFKEKAIQNLDIEIVNVHEESEIFEQKILLERDINQINMLLKEIDQAIEHVKSLITLWPSKFNISQFSDWMLNKKVRGTFSLSISDFFKLQFLKIIKIFSPAKQNLEHACEVLSQHDQIEKIKSNLFLKQNQLTILNDLSESILSYKNLVKVIKEHQDVYGEYEDLNDILRNRAIEQNRKIFELSVDFLLQEQYKRKKDLVEALTHWKNLLIGDKAPDFGKYLKFDKAFYELVSLAYPVVATTIASVYRMSGYKYLKNFNTIKPWNLTLVDEAGMISVEHLVPVLTRSSQAVIVGDPLQLEPIRTMSMQSIKRIYNTFFKTDDKNYKILGPGQATAYHRAAGALSGEVDDIGDGIVLNEHRRCQGPIAELFMEIAKYKGVSISNTYPSERISTAFKNMGGHHLMFYHVDGWRDIGRTNLDEINAVGELLDQLEEAGYSLQSDVAIITPYADQKRLLISRYGNRLNQKFQAKIGTVHQFQGVGFEVIIFSTVIFKETDSSSFINSRPNLLNVAVSRAKQQFIVVGNHNKLMKAKGALALIANKAAREFYLELGLQSPNFDIYSKNYDVERHLFDCHHIYAFEYYLTHCEHSIVIVVPWIRKPFNMTSHRQLDLLTKAKNRGIDIKVFYGYQNININLKNDNDEALVNSYKSVLGENNVIRIPQGTHEKVLLVDDRIMVIGSWNWLSNAYYKWCENPRTDCVNLAIRRETSIILKNRKLIAEYKAQNLDIDIEPSAIDV